MALSIDESKRKLIPTWKSYNNSVDELSPLKRKELEKKDILSYISDWREYNCIANAGDLLSAAIINNKTDDEDVFAAANFILQEDASEALVEVSNKIAGVYEKKEEDLSNKFEKYAAIAKLKKRLIEYPYDAISHIEIARLYLNLGISKLAETHVRSALQLDHDNRFVVRSAVRFFIHKKEIEYALKIIRQSSLYKIDPWLIASEISVCQLLNKTSKMIKHGYSIIESKNFSPFDITELSASIGMQELMSGSYKKSRVLFNLSMESPNSNSLAQAKWIVKNNNLNLDFTNVNMKNGAFLEANSYNSFIVGDYEKSLDYAKQWMAQEPYSTRAIFYANRIAVVYNQDIKEGLSIMKTAIETNKESKACINDYAYLLALDNKITEAEHELAKIKNSVVDSNDVEDVCLTATKGLIAFRNRNIDLGEMLYKKAVEMSMKHNNKNLTYSALLNYCRELLLCDSSDVTKKNVERMLNQIFISDDVDYEIIVLRNKVDLLLKRKIKTQCD